MVIAKLFKGFQLVAPVVHTSHRTIYQAMRSMKINNDSDHVYGEFHVITTNSEFALIEVGNGYSIALSLTVNENDKK